MQDPYVLMFMWSFGALDQPSLRVRDPTSSSRGLVISCSKDPGLTLSRVEFGDAVIWPVPYKEASQSP